jgi:hypothetical protein
LYRRGVNQRFKKEGIMRKISILIGAALLLLSVLGTAAFASPARAGAQETPLTGTETRHFGVPGRAWTAGSVTQVRDVPLTGTFAFSGEGVTLAGTETALVNAALFDGGGITWGVATYTDAATGVTCTGTVIGQIKGVLATLKLNAPCSDGKLLKGTLQDVSSEPPGQAPPSSVTSEFTGVLLSPGQN